MLSVLGTITLLLIAGGGPVEKEYGGIPLSQWRMRLADFDSASPRAAAAVPALAEILADDSVDPVTRRAAAFALGRIGAPARPALPALIEIHGQRDKAKADEAAWAAKAIALLGPHAREATPQLAAAVIDESCDFAVRQLSLEALARIGGAHPDAISAIIDVVQQSPRDSENSEQQAELRLLAVEAIGVAGGDAAVAAPLLARILQSPRESEALRLRSAEALATMGPAAHIARETLVETLVIDESEAVRDSAAKALAAIGEQATDVLTRSLSHPDTGVRWRAAQALGTMGEAARPSIAALKATAHDDGNAEIVRLHASGSLWHLDPTSATAKLILPTILQLFASENRSIRKRALDLFVALGPVGNRAAPQLQDLLRHERRDVRQIAQQALRGLEKTP